MKKTGKIIGQDSDIPHLDFSMFSQTESNKASMLLFNTKDYSFSGEEIDGKNYVFITIRKTNEKFDFVDYVKNKL